MNATKLIKNLYNSQEELIYYKYMFGYEYDKRLPFHCPICNAATMIDRYDLQFDYSYNQADHILYLAAYIICPSPDCGHTTILMEKITFKNDYTFISFEELLKDGIHKQIESSSLHCIHPLQENPELVFPHNDDKEFIPPQVLEDFLELQRISNFSPTASAMFARRFLERIILDKWPDVVTAKNWRQGFPSLDNMIDWLGEDLNGQMRYDNIDVMDAIRGIGNKTIHIYSSKENIGITSADIGEIIAELDAIITELYVYPAQRKQRKEHIASLAQGTLEKSKELKKATIEESELERNSCNPNGK